MPNLHVGAYGAFIWPAYALTAAILIWMVGDSVLRARAWRAKAEAGRKPREDR